MTETHIPNSCTLYVTSKCNLKCKFCRRQLAEMKKPKDMNLSTVKEINVKFPDIKGYCLCFTGDTKVKLLNGTSKTFKELTHDWEKDHAPFEVYSRDENLNIISAKAINPRIVEYTNKLIKITLDNNEIIQCTLDHEFMLRDGTYKKAQDLEFADSLMPLYTSKKYNGINKYEYISDFTYNGWTHRLIGAQKFKDVKNKTIHHIDENSLNNSMNNLHLCSNKEHIAIHANKESRKKIWNEKLKKWNESIEGKEHLLKHNTSLNTKESNSKRMKIFMNSKQGKAMAIENLKSVGINEILKNNRDPKNILNRKRGRVLNTFKQLLMQNLEINEINYEKNRKINTPKYKLALSYFSDINEIKDIIKHNHKIIKKEIINLDESIPVYCLSVPDYHNFALESGVFVKNCGFGETLINKDIFEIISYLKENNKFVGLITNGILVDKYIKEIKNSKLDYISVSLNASSKEEYIENTGSDCFNATLNNIKLLLKNNINTYVTYIVGKHNIKNVNKFVKLMEKIGVKTVYLHNLLPHSDEHDEFFESNVLTINDKSLLDRWITKSNIIKLYPTLVDHDNEVNYCKFSYYHVAVDGDGDLGICNSILPTSPDFGNLSDKNAFNNEYCTNFRMNVLLKMPLCKKCFRSMNEEARYK